MTTEKEQANRSEDQSAGYRDRMAKRLQGFSPFFELAVTFAAVATLVVTGCQTKYTRDALAETRKSTEAARVSADAAVAAVQQARDQFEAAENGATANAARDQARFDANLEQIKAQRAALEQQAAESRNAVAVARRQMLESLRAKVYFTRMRVDLDNPNPLTTGSFYNAGVSAAERISTGMSWTWGPPGRIPPAPPVIWRHFVNPLAPNGDTPFQTQFSGDAIPPAIAIEKIKTGEINLVVWMLLRYGDRFMERYPTEASCFVYYWQDKDLKYCESTDQSIPEPPPLN